MIKEPPKEEIKVKEEIKEPEVTSGESSAASRWPEIINYIKSQGGMPLYPHLLSVKAKMVGGKLCVVFDEKVAMSKGIASKPSNIALIKTAVREVTGEDLEVSCVTPKEIGETPEDPFKRLEELSKTHSEIQFI